MKKKLLSLMLALLMALCLLPAAVFAEGETVIDATDRNLIKITTTADFAAGELNGLEPASVGDGALTLAEGATEGTFTSAEYAVPDFYKMVASWNAAIYDGTSIEVFARAYTDDAWDDWFSWGKYGMSILRGCNDDSSVDEYAPGGTITKAQFRAVLRRDSASLSSPVLRQLTYSVKGVKLTDITPTYAETPVADLPASVYNASPAYAQGIRDPEIGGSICSPSTITVMLNARNPQLDLLPEELALSVQDFNYGFGNWAFCTSAAGLYGYEAYVQYGNKDILLQELANGRSVGLSVSYYTDPSSSKYLEGAYGGTDGHLITIIGYEYEGNVKDDDHLYFISSDTYSKDDATSFHRYKWTQLRNCWTNGVMYMVSSAPEADAPVTGVQRFDATLEPTEEENVYTLKADGAAIDLTDFTIGKMSTLGRGVLAYTIEGIATTESVESTASIVYEHRIQVSANNTFFYTGIRTNDDGNLTFNAGNALYKAGIPEGETRTLTVYAMANNGRRYTATLTAVSTKPVIEEDNYETVNTDGNLVHVDLSEGTLSDEATRTDGGVTLKRGMASGVYTTPIYANTWAWEYMIPTINAVTPGASTVELQMRAVTQRSNGEWSEWFSFGQYGTGIHASVYDTDGNVEIGNDIVYINGDSDVANAEKVQFRVYLQADADGNMPTVFGINFTYKKSTYDPDEAVYTGNTAVDALPKSASVGFFPASSYAYASGLIGTSWRFMTMSLMALNGQGADVLYEEVALNGFDAVEEETNWIYAISKAGLFGHKSYTQFGASPTLVQQAIADGGIVGVFVSTKNTITTTNSNTTRLVVVYAYETAEDGTVTFHYACPCGDTDELASGDVLNSCTAEELDVAIRAYEKNNVRGMMYVIGSKVKESSVQRVPVAAQIVDAATIRLAKDGAAISLPAEFVANKTSVSGCGVVAYTLASEGKAGEKLAANTFYYDITVNADGTLALPVGLQEKLAAGDTANLYVIRNNGVTYTAEIVSADTLAQQKADALAAVDAFLAEQPSELYGQAKELADQVKALIEAAKSPAEIEAALKLLETGIEAPEEDDRPGTGSGITVGGNTTPVQPSKPADPSPAPPQTGAVEGIAPFLCILAAAALFALSRKKRAR